MTEETIESLRRAVHTAVDHIAELTFAPVTWSYHEGSEPRLEVAGVATVVDLDEYTDTTWINGYHADNDKLYEELVDLLHTLERVAIVSARTFVADAGGTYLD
jgi:hypothetical protein